MPEAPMRCPYCRIVNAMTFWPWTPYVRRKRVIMGAMSIGLAIPASIGAYMGFFENPSVLIPIIPILMVCVFGLLVSLFGCETCVAKAYASGP